MMSQWLTVSLIVLGSAFSLKMEVLRMDGFMAVLVAVLASSVPDMLEKLFGAFEGIPRAEALEGGTQFPDRGTTF